MPIAITLVAIAAAFGIYKAFGKKKLPVLQSLRATTPGGTAVQVVVPVAGQPPPVSGVSATPLHPNNTGTGASYAPAPVVAKQAPGVLTLAPTVITPTGASSLAVTTNQDVQNALNTLSYKGADGKPLTVDGKIGPNSIFAIKAFQTSQGLAVDGVAGPNTKGALQTALATLAGANSAVGAVANTLAASADPPFGVEVHGKWTSGLGADFGRRRRRRKNRPPPPQQDGGGGNGGDGDSAGPSDPGDGDGGGDGADAGFGIGVVIPSQYPHVEDDGGEFGSSRMRGLAGLESNFDIIKHVEKEEPIPAETLVPTVQVRTIKDVQHALNILGASPPLLENNVFDARTLAAIKVFQIAHGLVADGVPGKKTKWALCLALNPNLMPSDENSDNGGRVEGELKGHSVGFG